MKDALFLTLIITMILVLFNIGIIKNFRKNKTIRKTALYTSLFSVLVCTIFTLYCAKIDSLRNFQNYIIENSNDIETSLSWDKKSYVKLTYDKFYFDKITIKKTSDNSYYLIGWAERCQNCNKNGSNIKYPFWWKFLSDFSTGRDLDYLESKGKLTEHDKKVMKIINNKLKNNN